MATAAMMAYEIGEDLREWAVEHDPDDQMNYKSGYWTQVIFVRDRLRTLFGRSYEESRDVPVRVVGTHTSNSIRLPVYSIVIPHTGEIRMRYNFHNWVVSVKLEAPVAANFMRLFNEREQLQDCYAEGFGLDWIFPPYAENHKTFSLTIEGDNLKMYAFCYVLAMALGLFD